MTVPSRHAGLRSGIPLLPTIHNLTLKADWPPVSIGYCFKSSLILQKDKTALSINAEIVCEGAIILLVTKNIIIFFRKVYQMILEYFI